MILLRFEDSLVLEGIGIAMTMYLIEELNYTANIEIVIIAVFIAFVFGYFAFRLRPRISGLFSTALVGIILLVFADPLVVPGYAHLLHPWIALHP